MEVSWESLIAAMASIVVPGGIWVGTIQQRVADHASRLRSQELTMDKITARIDEHIKITNDTNVQVGAINGKLDMLVAKHLDDIRHP